MCEWLAKRGHEVRVITAAPYYPDWKIFPGYKAWRYKTEIVNNVKVTHCPLWVPNKPTGLKRILHLMSFAVSSFFKIFTQIRWRPEIIFSVEPTIFAFPNALLLSKLTKAKLALHIQDFEIDAAFNLQFVRLGFMQKFLLKFERSTLRHSQLVSSISLNMCKKAREKGAPENNITLFPNWADLDLIRPLPSNEKEVIRNNFAISAHSIVCLYSGNIGEKQGLEIIIESAARLSNDPRFMFVISGNGPNLAALQKLATEKNLKNIRWLPLQPIAKFNELLNLANIHLLPQKKQVADLVLPSKLANMLASGRPIITTALSGTQIQHIVQSTGIVVNPDNPEDFTRAIKFLGDNKILCENMGNEARKYAEQFLNKALILAEYEKKLSELSQK